MTIIEKIKKFIDEKILKTESQKLLTAPMDIEDSEFNDINLTSINNFIKEDKYERNLHVTFERIKPSVKKNLLKSVELELKGIPNTTHDVNSILEGQVSGENYISVRRKNVQLNKVGQSIIMENGYIDISTRKRAKDNIYANLSYKEYRKTGLSEELIEYIQKEDQYRRAITIADTTFIESAHYPSEEELAFIENNAQPIDERHALQEYEKITKLTFISNDEKYNISNSLKVSPFLVKIEAYKKDKNGNVVVRKAINKLFKSKKECIVGYRPEMIYLENTSGENKMYRLIPNEGLYADNSSFKLNFEGKYSIRKVLLNDIMHQMNEIPVALSLETKNILRNGYKVPPYIKTIYEAGLRQIHAIELERMRKIDE